MTHPEPHNPEEQALGDLVLGYIDDHPQAVETLDGIAELWFGARHVHVNMAALSRALEVLVRRGVLEVIGAGPARRYRKRRVTEDAHHHTPEEEHRIREAALDETIAESFPASDPPSSLPNPDEHDAPGSGVEPTEPSSAPKGHRES